MSRQNPCSETNDVQARGSATGFAACFFLDAQSTAAAIVLGQSEAIKQARPAQRGTALSVIKSAFSTGPTLWALVFAQARSCVFA